MPRPSISPVAVCLNCCKPGPKHRCQGCEVAGFCDANCQKEAWPEHKRWCRTGRPSVDSKQVAQAAVAAARQAGDERGPEDFHSDAIEQVRVLTVLGLRDGAVVGQRPLMPEDISDYFCGETENLALKLYGRNSWDASYLPMLKAMGSTGLWPIMAHHVPGLWPKSFPSLEVCAALCTRILCVARRLRDAGQHILVVIGVGSRDALLEASVALHLSTILGQSVDLHGKSPIEFSYGSSFRILFLATDTPELARQSKSSAMTVIPYSMPDALRDFAVEEAPLYVLSGWPPAAQNWRRAIEECAEEYLQEYCFYQLSYVQQGLTDADMDSPKFLRTELFPKALCQRDFLAHGFAESGTEAGFFHSQLYVYTHPHVPRPFLAAQLTHPHGPYHVRMLADRSLEGVNRFRHAGLQHACCPKDLSRRIPESLLYTLKENENELDDCTCLQEAVRFADGCAHAQLRQLVIEST